jgi:eukaryotic-like serine/threonine-protein kinase
MATLTETIGRVLSGRYRIDAALGTGASAHVYLATDVTLKRRVAIKMLHPALAADRSFLKRFRAEAQAAASLTHPNLVAVYDWGEDSDGPYLVLEYLGGGSLRDLLDDSHPLGPAHVAGIGAQAAHGLAYAHARGFVHRDVKPANLLFDEDRRRLCVADFGLARALAEAAWTEPVGATLGTARYAAPEQAQGRRVDGRADVYALCLVLYEAITGSVPFGADTTIGTLMARVGAPLPGHDRLGPLEAILRAGAAPEAEERLNAAELARRLSEVARSLPRPGTLPEGRAKQIWQPYADSAQMGLDASDDPDASTGRSPAAAVAGNTSSGRASRRTPTEPDTGEDAMAIAEAIGITDSPTPQNSDAKSYTSQMPAAEPQAPAHSDRSAATGTTGDGAAASPTAASPTAAIRTAGKGAAKTQKSARTDDMTEIGLPPNLLAAPERTETPKTLVVKANHRRRWPWVALLILVLTGIASGALVAAQKHYQLFTPSDKVPSLAGLTPASATTAVAKDHFNVTIAGHAFNTQVPPGKIVSQTPVPGKLLKQGKKIAVVVSSGPPPVNVPNLDLITSGGCGAVTATLADIHLGATCTNATSLSVKTGGVISYQPETQATWGTNISVVISSGLPYEKVPDLGGMTQTEASSALKSAHFKVAVGSSQYSSTVPTGQVLPGWTGEGKTLLYGSTVTFSVSLGHAPVKIPSVAGDSQTKAMDILQADGFIVSAYGPNNDPVFATDPAAGSVEAYGSSVALYLGSNPT